jgi:hypothetical protein
MKLLAPFKHTASVLREFLVPRYRPELYYMRGTGPASAHRLSAARHNEAIDRYLSRLSSTFSVTGSKKSVLNSGGTS